MLGALSVQSKKVLTDLDNISGNQLQQALAGSGVEQNISLKIVETIKNAIVSGGRYSDLVTELNKVQSTSANQGQLSKYVKLAANDAINNYMGARNAVVAVPEEVRKRFEDYISGGQSKIPFGEYKGEFVEISKEDALKNLKSIRTHEESYSFLKDGTVYYKKGDTLRISFNADEHKLLNGAELYHSHPENGMQSLSREDIGFMIKHNLKSISSVYGDRVYTIRNSANLNRELLEDGFEIFYKKAESEVVRDMSKVDSKIYDDYRIREDHYINIRVAKLLGLKYEY